MRKTPQVIRGSSPPPPPPPLLVLLLLLLTGVCTDGYKPVVIVHGLFDGPKQFKTLSLYITKVHPGTEVTVVDLYNFLASLKPLWWQVQGFRKAIEPIMKKAPDGIHLLCFSQGGLICRALLSTTPDHNVHSFISLSSPLAGQYGGPGASHISDKQDEMTQNIDIIIIRKQDRQKLKMQVMINCRSTDTSYLKKVFPECMKREVFHFCYNRMGQKLSICDYWNDPHHRSRYLQSNIFLPVLNGDRSHKAMKSWRENFLRVRKLVLIGGPDDGVITPWQSSHFGFYDSNENIVEMRNQEFYRNDTFGLKTLVTRGDVYVCVHSGVQHVEWHSNFTVFRSCMEKWLT